MNSVGDAFGWAFRDPSWAGKMIVQALILIIPIVGWIAMTGWLMMAFENARVGRNELPPAGFHLARGIGIFGIFFIYGFVLNIPAWVLYIAGGIATGASHSQGLNPGSPLTGLGYLWSFLAGLFLNFLVPSLIVNTYHGGFTGGMDIQRVWRLAMANLNNSVVAGLIIFVASVIGGIGFFLCIVGFFTVVYQNTIQAGVAAWYERVQAAPAAPAAPGAPAA